MAYNKRDRKQKGINRAQERLDRDNARSSSDLKRNQWKKIKKNIITFFVVVCILFLIVMYLQK